MAIPAEVNIGAHVLSVITNRKPMHFLDTLEFLLFILTLMPSGACAVNNNVPY